MSVRRLFKFAIVVCLAVPLAVVPAAAASAKRPTAKAVKPAVTKLVVTLDASEWNDGDTITGTVSASYRSGLVWLPLAGATIGVTLDKVAVSPVTTGSDGTAALSFSTTVGSHVVKVALSKSASYAASKHAKGFSILGTWYADADLDGYGDANAPVQGTSQPAGSTTDGTDCDDADPAVNPGASEVPDNGVDDDCDGNAS